MRRDEQKTENRNDKYGIRSVERAVKILLAFTFEEPVLSLAQLARKVGLNRTTTFRMARSLCAYGLLEQTRDGNYCLGLKIFELGNIVAKQIDLRQIALPYLKELSERFEETAHLGILERNKVLYIEKVESPVHAVRCTDVGKVVDPYCTALGKCLLAGLKNEEIRALLPPKLAQRTPHTIDSIEKLLEEIERVRIQGYALDNEELEIGLKCVAAPLYDYQGKVAGAVSLSGPAHRFTPRRIEEMIAYLREISREISYRLGYRPHLVEAIKDM